jgi:hypothetical protein
MALRGNKVVISSPQNGKQRAGVLGDTSAAGTCMEIQTPFYQGGQHLYRAFQPGTDGLRRQVIVLLEDDIQGFGILKSDGTPNAGVSGTMRQFYWPVPGDEMNMLIKDIAGTADDHTAGDLLIINTGTGKLIASTGSEQSDPFVLLETVIDPTADFYSPCMFTGY